MSKIKLFTHTDLDGVGCAVVGKVVFGCNLDIEYCSVKDVNEKVEQFLALTDLKEYSNVFITDLSVNEKVAEIIDYKSKHTDLIISFKLLDHHKTALWLNKYDWATVESERILPGEENLILSGTTLFFEDMNDRFNLLKHLTALNGFVDAVRLYDTWEWKRLNLEFPKALNDIYHLVGLDEFVNTYSKKLLEGTNSFTFDPVHLSLLNYKRIETENYISKKLDQVKVINRVAFIVADSNISELGSKICETVDCDYCAIYTGQSVSLRSIGEFDVSVIAKEKGGGGHKNASGYEVDNLEDVFELVKPYTKDRKEMIEAEKVAEAERILAEKTSGYTLISYTDYDKHTMIEHEQNCYIRNDVAETDIATIKDVYFGSSGGWDAINAVIVKYGVGSILEDDGEVIRLD
jgi:oligoribonuclease NrnB/cAMP/cGMP phosphodiesterase (DHH superfamily)